MLDKTMSFMSQINNTMSKASKVLNFIKRNLSNCLQSTKESAYLSLVWPTLEYASACMGSLQSVYSINIEKIQRKASRWVLNDYNRYSNAPTIAVAHIGREMQES